MPRTTRASAAASTASTPPKRARPAADQTSLPRGSATAVVTLASGKGGTGKSTLALAVAQALAAEHGQRVTLLDLDPQAGATDYAGADPVDDPLTAAPISVHGVTLYRSGRSLPAQDAEAMRTLLARALGGTDAPDAAGPPEVLVVDLSPSLVDAAHRVVLAHPAALLVLAVRLDAGGIRAAQELVALATAAGRPYAVAPTFANARRALSGAMLRTLREFYAGHVLAEAVPDDARAAEAVNAGQPVTLYAPRSRAAEAIRAQAAELLRRLDALRTPAGGGDQAPEPARRGARRLAGGQS